MDILYSEQGLYRFSPASSNTLCLQANKGHICLKALLLFIHAIGAKQSRIIAAGGCVGVENCECTVGTGSSLDISTEGLNLKVLDVDARSSVGVCGINARGGTVGVEVPSIANGGICNCDNCKGRESAHDLVYYIEVNIDPLMTGCDKVLRPYLVHHLESKELVYDRYVCDVS
jgi:hypothetical protein